MPPSLLTNKYQSYDPHGTHRKYSKVNENPYHDLLQRNEAASAVEMKRRISGASGIVSSSPYVFLSHGDCHPEFVKKLERKLRAHEVNVYVDADAPSGDLKERILLAKDAILGCRAFLVVLTKESAKTQLVNDQLAFAEDKGKSLVPICLHRSPTSIGVLRELLQGVPKPVIDLLVGEEQHSDLPKATRRKNGLKSSKRHDIWSLLSIFSDDLGFESELLQLRNRLTELQQ